MISEMASIKIGVNIIERVIPKIKPVIRRDVIDDDNTPVLSNTTSKIIGMTAIPQMMLFFCSWRSGKKRESTTPIINPK